MRGDKTARTRVACGGTVRRTRRKMKSGGIVQEFAARDTPNTTRTTTLVAEMCSTTNVWKNEKMNAGGVQDFNMEVTESMMRTILKQKVIARSSE